MTQQTTSVRLQGGPKDGQVLDNVPSFEAGDTYSIILEKHWVSAPNGGQALVSGPLSSHWTQYQIAIYKKGRSYHKPTLYEYLRTEMVERCEGKDRSGHRCKRESIKGRGFCSSHISK